ncbi:BTAD domain-containing putative transcriptional regulator [Egicoccus sp. AB-alg2]|uniref:AfsR/SARP family transcriptional regulator n=1 Tax=Egicoccus sp. AB-alg2 TaxID=3242693 RepID=UPI00359D8E55
MVQIRLLGRPGAEVDGVTVAVAGRQPALLAALAIDARRVVSASRLVEVVWGTRLPGDPANALQQRVSSLRKLLDPHRTGRVLRAADGGYVLQVEDEQVDARRFEARLAEASRALAAGDAAAAEVAYAEALALWQGPALDGCAEEPWAVAETARLTELYLSAEEERTDAAFATGRGAELVAGLRDQVAAQPLRERRRGQLMLALYRAGRQADALAVHEATRQLLAEELGVDPGPHLQALHQQILRQDAVLLARGPDVAGGQPAAPARPSRDGNLPAATSDVVGRDDAVEGVGRLLEHARLVTLTGPGGAGKTTLALAAARRHTRPSHGTWLVELAPVTEGAALPSIVATALDLGGGGLAGNLDVEALTAAVAGQRRLVVLDNCEHLLDEVADVVARLLAAAPDVRVLATSRAPLGVPGEVVWSVPPLALPAADADPTTVAATAAVELFVQRVRAHTPTYALRDADTPAVADLVRRLDGLPLAIELAAARLRVLSLPEVLDGLQDRFRLLAARGDRLPSRQRSLRGALDWSWELLDQPTRQAWAVLALPAGDVDRTFATELLDAAGVPGDPVDLLADLVDRSLLVAETQGARARYRMLDSVRAYGRERVDEVAPAARAAHADAVERRLAAAHAGLDDGRFGVDVAALLTWLDEARTVLAWAHRDGDRRRLQRVAGRCGWAWFLRGEAREGVRWLDRGLGDPAQLDPADVDPHAVAWAGALRVVGLPDPAATAWADLAVAVAPTRTARLVATVFRAIGHARAGRLREAFDDLEAQRPLADELGGWPAGFRHLIRAQLGRMAGRAVEVTDDARAALELLTAAGVDWARAYAIDLVVDDLLERGETRPAAELAADGLALCRRLGYPQLEARLRVQLGTTLAELGELSEAREHLERAVTDTARAGRDLGLGHARLRAGEVARRAGDPAAADAHLQAASAVFEELGDDLGTALTHAELALLQAGDGDRAAAQRHARAAVAAAARVSDPRVLAHAEASLAAADGEPATPVP